jgi:DNA helicase-2/ATP-dependent DNA helicase PcrA
LNDPLQNLNPEQQKAVLHTEGPLLIVAGAGSGKTRVLTQRIGHLLGTKGVHPENILAVTFTNKAAEEIKHRIGVKMPWVGTFHSICLKLLRRHADVLGFPPSFVIFDTADQLQLVKKVLTELNYNHKQYDPRSILGTISAEKNELVSAGEYTRQAVDLYQQVAAKVYERYQQELKANSAMDFDDLLMYAVLLFQKAPELLAHYQEQFRYILIDEYQDTNHAQYVLTRELAKKHRNICVVGDSDQNIYSWRGADIRNILDFEKDYENVTVALLEQNYRSTRTILNIANAVISHNKLRKEKNLWSKNIDGDKADYFYALDEQDEAIFIIKKAVELKRARTVGSYNDIAVFYRTNAQSRAIEEVCLKLDIPYRIVGGIRFYERKEVKDILAYLRVLNNPDETTSLLRIINTPARGIGQTSLQHITATALQQGLSVWTVLQNPMLIPDRARGDVREFILLIKELRSLVGTAPLARLIDAVISKSGYRSMLMASKQEEDMERLGNIQELISIAEEKEQPLPDFLAEIALMSDLRDWRSSEEALTLMTLHSAKGLEFPAVFMAGMEEGLLPHFRSQFDPLQMEEERRLCYVGMTRAKEHLYLTSAHQRRAAGDSRLCERSRFLNEVPPEYLVSEQSEKLGGWLLSDKDDDSFSVETETVSYKRSFTQNKDISFDFKQGDNVLHTKWGKGQIRKVHGAGEAMTLEVEFPAEDGIKLVMPKYAPLQKV